MDNMPVNECTKLIFLLKYKHYKQLIHSELIYKMDMSF